MPAPADAAPPPLHARRGPFHLLFFCLLVVGVGNSMLLALLPPLVRRLGLPDSSIGWIFSLSALIWTFASPVWGRLSDRTGRKPIIVMGLAAFVVSMALFAGAVELGLAGLVGGTALFLTLVVTRGVFGLFGSATNPAAQAYVADRTTALARTEELATLTSAFALGATIGPAFCALLVSKAGLVAPVWIVTLIAAASAAAVWRWLPEEPVKPDATARGGLAASWRLALDPRLSPFLIFGLGLSTATGTTAQVFALFTMDRLDVGPVQGAEMAAAGFMVGALAILATQVALLPRLRLSARPLMWSGALMLGLGLILQIFAATLGVLLTSQLFQGIGFGLARSGFTGGASNAVKSHEQGAAAGLVVSVSGAGFMFSPLLGGLAYERLGMNAPLCITLVLLAAMSLFAWRSRRLKTQTAPSTRVDISEV